MHGMKCLNPDVIIGTSVAGSMKPEITPDSYLVLDQFIDFTKKTPNTIYETGKFAFVDFSEPYCPHVRKFLIQACKETNTNFLDHGCYVGINGPRYETKAEIRMFALLGGDVVGMTNVTETIFARELGMCYASLCIISNYATGISSANVVTRQDCYDQTIGKLDKTIGIIKRFIEIYKNDKDCDCHEKNSDMQTNQKAANS